MINKFKGLFEKKVIKTDVAAIYNRFDAKSFFAASANLWGPDELIQKIGGYQNFEYLTKDPEIFSAIDKRIAALLDTKLIIDGDNEFLVDFFKNQLLPHETQLKQDFWWTQFNGWGVEQIIYNPDRSGEIVGFQREEFWRFEPLQDLIHVEGKYVQELDFKDRILPYGKFVLTTNNGTSYNPKGNSLAERLIAPWYFKCTSDDLWIDFAKRFANGFLHAKIEDGEQKEIVKSELEKAGKSSIIVTDKNSELNLIQPNRDSSLYLTMVQEATKSIQKVILGETQTSDMQERGGSASASIHNEVRLEKTRADIKLVERAVNEVILQISLVNGFISDASEASKLPKCELIYDPYFNLEIATRDAALTTAGVKFTKKYFVDNYGFSEDDFEIVDTQSADPFSFSQKKKRSFLTKDNVSGFIGKTCCDKHLLEDAKGARSRDEVDDIVSLIDKNADAPIDPEDLISAILTSESQTDLDAKLLALFDNKNNQFADTMTEALYLSASKGALVGNPKVLKNEKE